MTTRTLRTLRSTLLILATLAAVPSARAGIVPPETLKTAMAALLDSRDSRVVRSCRKNWYLFRRIGNTCTRAIERMKPAIETAKAELAAEAERRHAIGCPTVYDYGCDAEQIRQREAAVHLEEAVWYLRIVLEAEIDSYQEAEFWFQPILRDNRMAALSAADWITKVEHEYSEYLLQ
jgi:hypothetical protein